MEEFLKQLGIDSKSGTYKNDLYIVDIDNSNDYGKIYSKLERSDLVDEVADNSQVMYESASIQFEGENYLITLLADFENDTYKMTIKEI